MLSHRSSILRGFGLVLVGLGAVLVQSSQADAGAFFHRVFGRQNCRQCYQQAPVQAAPAATTAPTGSYQSNSYEPSSAAPTVAPAPVAAPRYYNAAPSSSSLDQFRGDRKSLGKF